MRQDLTSLVLELRDAEKRAALVSPRVVAGRIEAAQALSSVSGYTPLPTRTSRFPRR